MSDWAGYLEKAKVKAMEAMQNQNISPWQNFPPPPGSIQGQIGGIPYEEFQSIPPAYVLLLYSGSNYKKLFCKDSQEALEKVREFQQDPSISQIMLFELQDVWARKWEKEKR